MPAANSAPFRVRARMAVFLLPLHGFCGVPELVTKRFVIKLGPFALFTGRTVFPEHIANEDNRLALDFSAPHFVGNVLKGPADKFLIRPADPVGNYRGSVGLVMFRQFRNDLFDTLNAEVNSHGGTV